MKKTLLFIFSLLFVCFAQAQNELYFGVYTGAETLEYCGTQKAETYDLAIHLDDPSLVGMSVVGLRVPIVKAANATDYKAWLTKSLTLTSGKNTPDIASVDFTPSGTWANVTFDEPYVITEEGVYVGYSLNIPSVDTDNDDDPAKKPLVYIKSSEQDNFYIHTARTVRKWSNWTTTQFTYNGVPAMVVRLSGEKVKEYAAAMLPPDEMGTYVATGKKVTLTLPIINHGTKDITNIDYDLHIGGEVISRHVNVSLKGTYFGRRSTVKVEIPAQTEGGIYPVDIHLTKLNGQENMDDNATISFSMAYLAEFPKHKPLMEEYTGTWCQWCVSGIAAMEAMNELYGDDFVGIAFHNGDPMTITVQYPNDVSSFPNAYLDRVQNVSPFGGSSGASLGIQDDWKKRGAIIAPASLTMEAHWADEAKTKLDVTSTTTFVRDFSNNPYQLTYILTADGLKGNKKDWFQVNGYAGNESAASDKYLGPYTKLSGLIVNIEFNDVAIQLASSRGLAMSGTLPASVSGNVPYSHTYTFDISENTLVQDKTKLRPVAVLINTLTGEVINAEKVRISDTSGISSTSLDARHASTYDLSGRRVKGNSLPKGIYIVDGKKVVK